MGIDDKEAGAFKDVHGYTVDQMYKDQRFKVGCHLSHDFTYILNRFTMTMCMMKSVDCILSQPIKSVMLCVTRLPVLYELVS